MHECYNICVLHFQQNKLFVHSVRSADSIARFKDRIETVYLDSCGSDSKLGSEHIHGVKADFLSSQKPLAAS